MNTITLKIPDVLKGQISKKTEDIESILGTDLQNLLHHEKLSLYVGRPGIMLVRSLIASEKNSALHRNKAIEDFDFILKELRETSFVITPFASGIAGLSFAFTQMNAYPIFDENIAAIIDEIDDVVEEDVGALISHENYDLLHGVLGIGVHLIRSQRKEAVEKIIKSLEKNAVRSKNEIKWKRFDKHHSKRHIYDFGLAHGNAGILFFLGYAFKNQVCPEFCKKLILGLFGFYKNNVQDFNVNGSNFPYAIDTAAYENGNSNGQHTRLAWCYGDLGILVTLIQVAKWVNAEDMAFQFEELLERCVGRRLKKDVQVVDACFCHGSAGNAFLYKQAYYLTGNKKFREESLYWLSNTLEMANQHDSKTGFGFLVGTRESAPFVNDFPGLLEGFSGVYLVLRSFISDEDELVKRLFFLG